MTSARWWLGRPGAPSGPRGEPRDRGPKTRRLPVQALPASLAHSDRQAPGDAFNRPAGSSTVRASDRTLRRCANDVVDYTQADFTRNGQRYDLILDVAGNRSVFDVRRVLNSGGTLVVIGGPKGRWLAPVIRMLEARVVSRFVSQKLVPMIATNSKEDLVVLKELIEAGKSTPVIDRTYPLSETREAIRYLEQGHARAKVIITV